MTGRTLTVAFVILFLSLAVMPTGRAVAASAFFVTGVVWGTPGNPVEAAPGDRNVPLTVTLQYSGTRTATSIHAALMMPKPPFTDINGAQTAYAYTGGIAPNSYFSLVFNLNIGADAVIGKYTMALDIYWSTVGGNYGDEFVSVSVNLKGKTDITFSAQPVFLNAGQNNNITIKMKNQGTGSAYEVKTSVSAPPTVILLNQLPQISRLDAQSVAVMNLTVYVSPTAAGSPISMSLTVTYKDTYLNSRSLACTLGFVAGYTSLTVSRVFWGSSAVPIEVQPGDDNQPLTVVIVNSGTVLAQNVTATLIIESPFSYQYTSGGEIIEGANETSSVGTIMPGASGLAQFTLSIEADSASGLYKLKMMLYMGGPPVQTTVDIPVRGYSDVALQKISVLPPKVYPGDKNVDLKVSVTNAGNAAAKNVSVEILQAPYVRPSWGGAESFFIGTIQPGQIVSVDFYIDVDESAPSPNNDTLTAKMVYGPTRSLEKSQEIPLFLSAKSRFVVTSTKIPEIHVSDTGIVIQVTFKNNGTEAAQGTGVEIEVPNVFSGTTTDYLGTVEAGEEKTASFVLNIDPSAKVGSYVLNQRMSWSQTGATHLFTQDLSLELNILENPLSKLLPDIIIILLVMVAAAIIVVALRRRSHSGKTQAKQK